MDSSGRTVFEIDRKWKTPPFAMSQAADANISTIESLKYWNSISTTVDGMLGGFPQISRTDLKGSANFLAKIRREYPSSGNTTLCRGLDCGAGIGRITAGFLSTVCEVVDMVEPVEKFTQQAKVAKMAGTGSIGNVYVIGLETWQPEEQYDLIWNQWCLGHLTDKELVGYLKRCKEALTVDGWIIIKENISSNLDGTDIFDATDSSVTRSYEKFQQIFKEADIRLMKTEIQRGFPKDLGLLPVRTYALRP